MKKLITLVMLAIIGVSIIGCKKKSTTPSTSLSVNLAGTTKTFSTATASGSGSIMQITGYSGSSSAAPPYYSITIYNFTGPATYTVDMHAASPTVASSYWPTTDLADSKVAVSGSVTITSSSSATVSGTFDFTAYDGTTMSSGTFTAKRI